MGELEDLRNIVQSFRLLELVLISIYVFSGEAFILRLPECKYFAYYTDIKDSQYFNGQVEKTLQNITRRKCSLHCTMNHACVFYNHKKDNSTCELIRSHIGTLMSNASWQIISTDYTDVRYRGQFCRFVQPNCDYSTEYCIDSCEDPGYRCKKYKNVAKKVSAQASSVYNGRYANNVADESRSTFWVSRSDKENPVWIKLNLGKVYPILFITIVNRINKKLGYSIKGVAIKIDNKVCVSSLTFGSATASKHFRCQNGIMNGQVVTITKKFNSYSPNYLTISDIMVYSAFDE